MKKAKPQGVIGSAECARRTGLTVRALRVYERAGLIKPQRGANGWRGYGQDELRRLNHIITLKSLGLSLREIRGVLAAPVPTSLKSILELQLRSWLTRQAATLQALKLVNAALERLAANQSLQSTSCVSWPACPRPISPKRSTRVSGSISRLLSRRRIDSLPMRSGEVLNLRHESSSHLRCVLLGVAPRRCFESTMVQPDHRWEACGICMA